MQPEMLLAFQSVMLILLFVSMAFRMKSNYLAHGVIIIGTVAIKLIAIIGRSASSILSGESMEPLMSPFSTMAVFGAHSFFGIATLVSAIWLIALWRPRSTDFAVKSKRIWQSTVILWVLAFAVGLLLYVALTTTLL